MAQMSKKSTYLSIAFWLTIASILGKLLGFLKDILISYYYGSSALTDAIFLALSIPMIVLGVFTASTDSVIIPQYNRIDAKNGRLDADRNFSSIVNSLFLIGTLISLGILLFPKFLVNIIAPGFTDLQIQYSTFFLKIFSFTGLLHIVYCFFCSYIVRFKYVKTRSILSFSTNLILVISLFFFHDSKMIFLAYTFLFASIFQAFFPLISAYRIGYKYSCIIEFKNSEYHTFWKIFIPIMGASLMLDLNMFFDRFVASNFGDGAISALSYASRITSVFDSMIVVGIGVVILPLLSKLNLSKDVSKFKLISTLLFKYMFIILLPIFILCMIYAHPIVELIYKRGNFDAVAVITVGRLLFYYSPLVLFISLQTILSRFFHSLEDTKTPMRTTFWTIIINVTLNFILSKYLGLNGVALATSIAIFFNVFFLFITFNKRVGWSLQYFQMKDVSIILSAVLLLIVVLFLWRYCVTNYLFLVFCGGLVSLLVYYAMIVFLLRKELKEIYHLYTSHIF